MHEISPVLAGTFDAADYAPAASNINQSADTGADLSSTSSIDPRRYTKWDKSATEVAAGGDFTFDDFLDMVNPLEHIPVVSSIYRGVTNEDINPVSRVVGDIMYGGIFGLASAVMGGLGAAADSMVVAETGHDVSGNVVAYLFGTDNDKNEKTQLADNKTTDPAPAAAAVDPSDPTTAALLASISPSGQAAVQNQAVTPALTSTPVKDPNGGFTLAQAKAFPITPNKLPYGGAMAPPNFEAQNTAIALAESSHSMRMGNMIYTSPLMNGAHPLPAAAAPKADAAIIDIQATSSAIAAPATTTPAPAIGSSNAPDVVKTSPQKNPIPQNLVDDMVMMQALKQYKGVASGPASNGTTIDLTN